MNTGSATDIDDRRVLVLYGPTAVGKTELLRAICTDRCEVISADSRQVYRHLDIGTAKPDSTIRESVIHHLLDICDPNEQYTAGKFVRDADRLVADIRRRGSIPIVAGGTGYYLRNFIFGLPDNPGAFPEIRAELKREMGERGIEEMYRELQACDGETAGRLSPRDRYRIERALEVYRGTGRPLSSFHVSTVPRTDHEFVTVRVGLPRDELHRRIDARVDGMLEAGLLREIAGLLSAGYRADCPGLRTIGYREVLELRENGCGTIADAVASVKRNTRRYAKRQLTYFRMLPAQIELRGDDVDSFRAFVREHMGTGL